MSLLNSGALKSQPHKELHKCPERDETTPTCPAHQARIFVMENEEALYYGYHCPRRPRAHSFDVGFSAQDVQAALSRPPPPANCATASTSACLEPAWYGSGGLIVDENCCAQCGEGGCAPEYTYAGQIAFDEETLLSLYPDFGIDCNAMHCGNTCCVPSDEWDGAHAVGD